ncbi:MAG TPA: cupin domain-containing protein [Caldimonas sp.]|nr:cupin domain-containing protein [Caldimonas sp.]HEX4234618.1 cupin domain-containing protein [Caldimonas sp.]
MSSAPRPIVNLDELAYTRERRHGERIGAIVADVAGRIGAKRLGYNVTRLEPGRAASPFHSHHVGEEMFFILEGSGTLRFGSARYPVRKGDFIACPPGGAEIAHQLIAGPDGELAFIGLDQRAMAGRTWAGGEASSSATFDNRYVQDGSEVEYWIGE